MAKTLLKFFVGLGVLSFVVWAAIETLPLRFEIEGLWIEPNYRDVGKSLNQCLVDAGREPLFVEGKLHRANKWFSGWSCQNVGAPDAILTLDSKPPHRQRYFCFGSENKIVKGEVFNTPDYKFNDIEFSNSWDQEGFKESFCPSLAYALKAVIEKKSLLFHCEAGRDRTGAFAALLTTLGAETVLNKEDLEAIIECDYQKSHSIVREKYGRMQRFSEFLSNHQNPNSLPGSHNFLASFCGLDPELFVKFRNEILLNQEQLPNR